MTLHPLVLSLSRRSRPLVYGAALFALWLFADRIVAGLTQCAAAGSCPW